MSSKNSFENERKSPRHFPWRGCSLVKSCGYFHYLHFSSYSCNDDEPSNLFYLFHSDTKIFVFDLPTAGNIQTNLLGWKHTTKCSDERPFLNARIYTTISYRKKSFWSICQIIFIISWFIFIKNVSERIFLQIKTLAIFRSVSQKPKN